MTTEIICALVATGGTLVSAFIAFFVSRSTANKELEKMKLTWEREDVISSDDEFAEMAADVAVYLQSGWSENQRLAMSKIASIRSKEIGAIAVSLDRLYAEVSRDNRESADTLLTEVINQKREAKRNAKTTKRNKPKK